MPFTLAHPAIVVPLSRLSPRPFILSALVVGSMSPDFEYFVYLRPVRTISHDFIGIWLLCVPAGLLVLTIFEHIVKQPLIQLLPERFRLRLLPYGFPGELFPPGRLLGILLSLAVGAFSHIAWDACTHENGWVVQRVTLLSSTILDHHRQPLKVYKVLQYGSTLVGLSLLASWSWKWIKQQPLMTDSERSTMTELMRIIVLAILLTLPCLFGVAQALRASSDGLYRMAGHFVVSSISAEILLLLVYSMLHRIFTCVKVSRFSKFQG